MSMIEAAKNLPGTVGAISSAIHEVTAIDGSVFIVIFVVLLGYVLWKFKWLAFFDFVERRRRRALTHIDQYLAKDETVDERLKAGFVESRDIWYFATVTGLRNFGKPERDALLDLKAKLPRQFSWDNIAAAQRFLVFDKKIVMKFRELSKRETWDRRVTTGLVVLSLFVAISSMGIVAFLVANKDFARLTAPLAGVLAYSFTLFATVVANRPYQQHRRLVAVLKEEHPELVIPRQQEAPRANGR